MSPVHVPPDGVKAWPAERHIRTFRRRQEGRGAGWLMHDHNTTVHRVTHTIRRLFVRLLYHCSEQAIALITCNQVLAGILVVSRATLTLTRM